MITDVSKPSCRKCGTTGRCIHHRGGAGMEYIDYYSFHCDSCGYSATSDKRAGIEGGEIEDTHCPYCGVVWDEHAK